MRTLVLGTVLALCSGVVLADGIRMTKDHHFVSKREKCYTIKLTKEQVKALESKREGEKPLYVDMTLTAEQREFLVEKTGKRIFKVLVFEEGWNDCGCCAVNIASRFASDRVEVSDSYLSDEVLMRKAAEARQEAEEARQEAEDAARKAKETE